MKRFLHALKHESLVQLRTVPIAMMAVGGSVLLITMVSWIFDPEPPMLWNQFIPVAFIVLTLFTSAIFTELRDEAPRIEYLLRPATNAQKAGAKLLVSTVGYWLLLVLIWTIASLLARVFYSILLSVPWTESAGKLLAEDIPMGEANRWGSIPYEWMFIGTGLAERVFRAFLAFIPVHAVFFFGSVYFRRKGFGRTLLSLVVWGISYFVIGVVLVRLIFAGYWASPVLMSALDGEQVWQIVPKLFHNPARAKTALDIGIAVVFYLLSWRRLVETEG